MWIIITPKYKLTGDFYKYMEGVPEGLPEFMKGIWKSKDVEHNYVLGKVGHKGNSSVITIIVIIIALSLSWLGKTRLQ